MKEPPYLLHCFIAIIVGCPLGAFRFELAMAAKYGRHDPRISLPITISDLFLVGWFPVLLFGALLHDSMQRRGWSKSWQWVLSGAFLVWALYCSGTEIEKAGREFLSSPLGGVTLLNNTFDHAWPAAICGAIVSAVLCWVRGKVAAVATPAAAS
jgi:hypothetical protein